MDVVLQVSGLNVAAGAPNGIETPIVRDVSFSIAKGEVLALIGESGSGKTTIALAAMGYARPGCRIVGGSVRLKGQNVLALDRAERERLRGSRLAYVAQSAASAFNPSLTLMSQVIESPLIHRLMDRSTAEASARALFTSLALPDPERIGARYPHQVSGGQLQRLMAAAALITNPDLVILDEPTTALDVTTQIEVLRAFKAAVRERGATAIYVSHDLAVVAQMADRILVLKDGVVREMAPTAQILQAPEDDYTRTLIRAARPHTRVVETQPAPLPTPLITLSGVSAGYGGRKNESAMVLRDIHLSVPRGASVGVIGESGSGKSTLARVIAGLTPAARGEIRFDGEVLAAGLKGRTRDQFRRIQLVFQNADTALNPSHSVARILARPLRLYYGLEGPARNKRVRELLDLTRLPSGVASRRCGELSGGQKQRVNLARALAASPDLVLCDEVTSALDTVVGAAVLDLLAELRRELGLSYLFISHDISTVRALCDEIVVLHAGVVVEQGPRAAFAAQPLHPYTRLLLSSVPELRPGWLEETPQRSDAVTRPPTAPGLCRFLERCPVRVQGLCDRQAPPLRPLRGGKLALCHLSEAALSGASQSDVVAP